MTIFNWVQQKLHKNVIKGDVTNNEKKKKRSEGISEIEKNTKAILDHVGLVDALDNWFDGVLTIGTFGFDTLKFQEEDQRDDYYDDDDDECDGVDLDYVVIDGSIIKNVDQELDPLISNQNKSYDHHHDLEVLDLDHFDSMITLERPMVMAKVEAEIEPEKKRTTLAELFMIDHNGEDATWREKKKPKMNPNLDDVGGQEVNNYKQNGSKSTSNKFLFGKKKKKKMMATKSKDKDQEHSRPVKKVHQMIKRMLKKKKIHPHIDESKALEKEVLYKPTNY